MNRFYPHLSQEKKKRHDFTMPFKKINSLSVIIAFISFNSGKFIKFYMLFLYRGY